MTAPQTEQHQDLRAQLVRLIIESSDGDLTRTEVDAAAGSLSDLGYSSLSYIRLIDGIENELGVYIDPDADAESFATLDRLVGLVRESREGSGG